VKEKGHEGEDPAPYLYLTEPYICKYGISKIHRKEQGWIKRSLRALSTGVQSNRLFS